MKTVIEMAREAGATPYTNRHYPDRPTHTFNVDHLERFVELVRADEREQIENEWSMCVQSDLEHGVKSLNEQAAKDWRKNYPEIAKFGAWLATRSET